MQRFFLVILSLILLAVPAQAKETGGYYNATGTEIAAYRVVIRHTGPSSAVAGRKYIGYPAASNASTVIGVWGATAIAADADNTGGGPGYIQEGGQSG